MSNSPQITALLHAWRGGNTSALDELLPQVHGELRAIARRLMSRERQNQTLQPTALVNEAFLRLVTNAREVEWKDRAHFLGICANLMRQVLVDGARKNAAEKRGGHVLLLPLDNAEPGAANPVLDILVLEEALKKLAAMDKRKSKVFELRFFGGLEVEEAAEVLQVSSASVVRDWKFVKAWLRKELFASEARGAGA